MWMVKSNCNTATLLALSEGNTPYLGGQHGVSRTARGRFSHSERP